MAWILLSRHSCRNTNAVCVNRAGDNLAVKRPFAFSIAPQLSMRLGIKGCQTVLSGYENILLAVMLDEQRRGVGCADGAILLPANLARFLVEADQETGTVVMIPREEHAIVHDQRAQAVTPGHLGIAETSNVTVYPDQLAF